MDNQRLREIQNEKRAYAQLLNDADSISDCITYQSRIDELEKEELDILKRCDVL